MKRNTLLWWKKALALASNIDVVVKRIKGICWRGIKVQLERTSRAQDQSAHHVGTPYGLEQGNSWEVSRRYNEFLKLRDSLSKGIEITQISGKAMSWLLYEQQVCGEGAKHCSRILSS